MVNENSETPPQQEIPFRFTGSASEYFQIWIVNTFLTLITLGVFSAWAKVRTKRYFYSNTSVDGSVFEYLGDPHKILKGRLIVTVAVVAGAYFVYTSEFYEIWVRA